MIDSILNLLLKLAPPIWTWIPQDLSTTSNLTFSQITTSNKFIIGSDDLVFSSGVITGSFTHSGTLTTSSNLVTNGNLTIKGTTTAEKIETENTQSVTLFESG